MKGCFDSSNRKRYFYFDNFGNHGQNKKKIYFILIDRTPTPGLFKNIFIVKTKQNKTNERKRHGKYACIASVTAFAYSTHRIGFVFFFFSSFIFKVLYLLFCFWRFRVPQFLSDFFFLVKLEYRIALIGQL